MSPATKMSNLFDSIDTTSSGTISKSQFEKAFASKNPPASFKAAGADAVWSKLDPNGTGSVSKQDFISGMTTMMKQMRGQHQQSSSSAGAQTLTQNATLLSAISGTSSATTATLLDALSDTNSTSETSGSGSSDSSTVGTILDSIA